MHSILIAARETEADHMPEEEEQRQRHWGGAVVMKGDSGKKREQTQGKELSLGRGGDCG